MTPQVGDIWKELDPRFPERQIVVLKVYSDTAVIQRRIRTPETLEARLVGPERRVQLKRFNGKRGGYEFVQRSTLGAEQSQGDK